MIFSVLKTERENNKIFSFYVDYNPEQPKEPIRHEVWAKNKVREELKALKLKKDDSIEAVLYRHTWIVELQGGEKQTHTRHNLSKVIKIERKEDAKRSTQEHAATSE